MQKVSQSAYAINEDNLRFDNILPKITKIPAIAPAYGLSPS